MPAIKKESFGTLSNGQVASVYTLRNNKGNEFKVTDYGARVVSLRFRNKNFENKFILIGCNSAAECEKDDKNLGVVYVDGSDELSKKIWNAEQIVEGVKFSIKDCGRDMGISDITTSMVFSGEVLTNSDFKVFSDEFKGGKTGEWKLIDKPAEVEFVEGMFGFDIGCPIDYYDAGLKNAAEILSEEAGILLQVYANQDKLHIAETDGGFAVKTSGSKIEGDVLKAQTVYVLKNK